MQHRFFKCMSSLGATQSEAAATAIVVRELVEDLQDRSCHVRRLSNDDGEIPFRVRPDGTIETLERLGRYPCRRRGTVEFHAAADFSAFVNRFKNHTTLIFADRLHQQGPMFTAVLDYHPAGQDRFAAAWDEFRATYLLRKTQQWLRWEGADGQEMGQVEFAQFLEDNIPDIADPDGALIVDIARTLEAKTDVRWKSKVNMTDGSRDFQYTEDVNASAGVDGSLKIPAVFQLYLQPFEGSSPQTIQARLRFRVSNGGIKLWFELARFDEVVKAAFEDELTKIMSAVNGAAEGFEVPIYRGPAPTR